MISRVRWGLSRRLRRKAVGQALLFSMIKGGLVIFGSWGALGEGLSAEEEKKETTPLQRHHRLMDHWPWEKVKGEDWVGRRGAWLDPAFEWDEAILSWNTGPLSSKTQVEYWIQVRDSEGARSPWFSLGRWDLNRLTNGSHRTSLNSQRDPGWGRVETDVFVLAQEQHGRCAIRIEERVVQGSLPHEPYVALCLSRRRKGDESGGKDFESSATRKQGTVSVSALDVVIRSQGAYAGEDGWCSPTSLSMILDFWGRRLGEANLRVDVPEVVESVFDPGWEGTGNWSFNVAYAGSFGSLRGVVNRFEDMAQLEAWVGRGIPVAASVCLHRLRGAKQGALSGHLVVVVGFDEQGRPILNDPGSMKRPRWTPERNDFRRAWATSRNTVYLIVPVAWQLGVTQRFPSGP